jgi:cardiolipin synthase
MDMRSFTLDLEISVMIHGEPFLSQLREVEDAYRAVSRELTLEEWRERPFRLQTVDNLMRLTAGLQ